MEIKFLFASFFFSSRFHRNIVVSAEKAEIGTAFRLPPYCNLIEIARLKGKRLQKAQKDTIHIKRSISIVDDDNDKNFLAAFSSNLLIG
jgi:hypothetical protein